MWHLFWARDRLIGFLVAITLLDAAALALVVLADGAASSFSGVAHAEIDGPALYDAVAGLHAAHAPTIAAVALALGGGALWNGWLRAGFLLGLSGRGATLRPPPRMAARLALYWLVVTVCGLGATWIGERGLLLPYLLALAVLGLAALYADYAIALDGLPVGAAFVRSVQIVIPRLGGADVRPRQAVLGMASFWLWLAFLISANVVDGAFSNGISGAGRVQPTYAAGWVLAVSLAQYVFDVVLLTLYVSAAAASGRSAAAPASDPD
jgi:hypothetical protein